MNALQHLEELFVKYQRLNQILKDNWNDTTQQSFDSNYLTPIATEWCQYHNSVSDIQSRFESTKRELEQDMADIERECNEIMREGSDCRLNGCWVYGAHCLRGDFDMTKHFIVDPGDINHLDAEDLKFMVLGRFPSIDDVQGTFVVDSISIY